MRLENLVMQARDPERAGRFWSAALGLEGGHVVEADYPGAGYEARLQIPGGPWLDVCIEPVSRPPEPGPRLHLDLLGGVRQREVVDRLVGLGAVAIDIGQRDVPWIVLADPDGNPFCVMEERSVYTDTGEADLQQIVARGFEPVTSLVRRSSLEDVFLRLTGRSLADD